MTIHAYRKYTDANISRELHLPDGATELATLDGITYVHLPANTTLPAEQPAEIEMVAAAIDAALLAAIAAASPHVRLINARVCAMIAERYSIGDEIKMLQLAPSVESTAYNDYVKSCRAWGRAKKEAIGL
ncbi:MAG: hypothetical protein AUJ57_07810 [Zetaproteobacteria bacterium CG1_02_53_45]|nr:MAG: hypothetical protein AUJ57_07810 [Zetaproteobacteria bacterium CG1_02_53_45]